MGGGIVGQRPLVRAHRRPLRPWGDRNLDEQVTRPGGGGGKTPWKKIAPAAPKDPCSVARSSGSCVDVAWCPGSVTGGGDSMFYGQGRRRSHPALPSSRQSTRGGPSRKEVWRSTVKVERCRYLDASKCKGTCINLCKVPTEAFFTEDLGEGGVVPGGGRDLGTRGRGDAGTRGGV